MCIIIYVIVFSALLSYQEVFIANTNSNGQCRGNGWNTTPNFPYSAGIKTINNCATACNNRVGCTGFDIKQNNDCYLFGHSDIQAEASGPEWTPHCYKKVM